MKQLQHELKNFLKLPNVIVLWHLIANWQQCKCLLTTLFELAYGKYGPDRYLAKNIKKYTRYKQIVCLCARAKAAPANLGWLQAEGYFDGEDFEKFSKYYLKEFIRRQRAKHCLKQILKLSAKQYPNFEQVLAYVYHTTGDVPYPFEQI